jgi:hypothetical protein
LFLKENPKISQELKEKVLAAGGHVALVRSSGSDEAENSAE